MIAKANGWGRVMLAVAAGLVLASAAAPAMAALLAYEPFIQESGNPNPDLVGNWTGGTGFGDNYWAWKTGHGTVVHGNSGIQYTDSTGKALVQSGYSLEVRGSNLLGQTDLTRSLTTSVPTTGTYYVSAVFDPAVHGHDYGIGLPGSPAVLGYYGDTSSDYWGIESFNDSSGPAATGSLDTVLLVAKIVKGSPSGKATATLWVNPKLGDEAGSGVGTTAAINSNAAWSGINLSVYLAQTFEAGTLLGRIADFRLGDTFSDVTPSVPVPEPSTLMLVVTGVMGLLAYAWRKRK